MFISKIIRFLSCKWNVNFIEPSHILYWYREKIAFVYIHEKALYTIHKKKHQTKSMFSFQTMLYHSYTVIETRNNNKKSNIFEHFTCTLIYTFLLCWFFDVGSRRRHRRCCCLFLEYACAHAGVLGVLFFYFVFLHFVFIKLLEIILCMNVSVFVRSIFGINFTDSKIRSVKSCTTFE